MMATAVATPCVELVSDRSPRDGPRRSRHTCGVFDYGGLCPYEKYPVCKTLVK